MEKDELLTVGEMSKLLKVNRNAVGELLKSGLLPYMVFGSKKVKRSTFNEFLNKYEGYDLSDLNDIKPITQEKERPEPTNATA